MLLLLGAQIVGALLGIFFKIADSSFLSAWIGGAFLTAPAYFVGIAWQAIVTPEMLRLHRKMVLRGGGISLLLTLAAGYISLYEPTSRYYNGTNETLATLVRTSQQLQKGAALANAADCRFSRQQRSASSAYLCQVPDDSRDAIRAALVSGGWEVVSPPPNALLAYRRQKLVASFVCPWKAGYCELWLRHEQ
jgi:hypothetical protein